MQQKSRDQEIDRNPENVRTGGNKWSGGNSRVQIHFFEENRHDRSHHGGNKHGNADAQTYRKPQ